MAGGYIDYLPIEEAAAGARADFEEFLRVYGSVENRWRQLRELCAYAVDNTIEIWAKEKAEQPFMNPEEFSEALQDILGEENLEEEEAETSDKSVE